jgi:hypothetical protein
MRKALLTFYSGGFWLQDTVVGQFHFSFNKFGIIPLTKIHCFRLIFTYYKDKMKVPVWCNLVTRIPNCPTSAEMAQIETFG